MGYAATILAEASLLHYWKLQELTGASSYYDEVASGKISGVPTGGPTSILGREHDDYNALQLLRATPKYIKFPLAATIQGAWAVECISRLDTNPVSTAGAYLWGSRASGTSNTSETTYDKYGSSTAPGLRVNIADGAASRAGQAAGTQLVTTAVGDWHHIVVTADSTNASLIVDGVETVISYTGGSAAPMLCHSSGGIVIGNYNYATPDANWAPDLTVQHFAVYNARMSQAKAAAHYAQIGTAPVRTPIIGGNYDVSSSGLLSPSPRVATVGFVHNGRPLWLPDTDFIPTGGGTAPRPDVGQIFPRGHS